MRSTSLISPCSTFTQHAFWPPHPQVYPNDSACARSTHLRVVSCMSRTINNRADFLPYPCYLNAGYISANTDKPESSVPS